VAAAIVSDKSRMGSKADLKIRGHGALNPFALMLAKPESRHYASERLYSL
jgi:hypothetical protein